jgi:hypothetical protein
MAPAPLPFPAFLAPAFDARDLEEADATIAVIDPDGNILWVNRAWDTFAQGNGAVGDEVSHGSYLDQIAPPLRDFYRAVFANALATGEAYDLDYECSSPERHRRFHLRALPIDAHGMLLEHSRIAEGAHDRTAEDAVEERYQDAEGMILQCSNCRRVRGPTPQAWDWVPRWVARPHPRTSHVICPSCVGFYWGRRSKKS